MKNINNKSVRKNFEISGFRKIHFRIENDSDYLQFKLSFEKRGKKDLPNKKQKELNKKKKKKRNWVDLF